MTRLNLDASTATRLRTLSEPAEVCDDAGQPLGVFYPAQAKAATRVASPFSRDDLERRRQQRSGRSLSEILKDLGAV